MTFAEANYTPPPPDIVMPASPIRLPGIAGPVMWRAEIDPEDVRMTTLAIELPNGAIDTVRFDAKTGVHVSRHLNDAPIRMTPEMQRQTLIHARIISGVHLQLAMENAI